MFLALLLVRIWCCVCVCSFLAVVPASGFVGNQWEHTDFGLIDKSIAVDRHASASRFKGQERAYKPKTVTSCCDIQQPLQQCRICALNSPVW